MLRKNPDTRKAPAWIGPVLVASAAAAANWNVLGNGFISDDIPWIVQNPYIRSLDNVGKIFSTNLWPFAGPDGLSNYYRPLMYLLYMADYGLFGLRAAGYHFTGLLFHIGCSLMVFFVGRALAETLPAGSAAARPREGWTLPAALLFAAHPVHTEAVAWVSAMTDLACAFFFLLSFYLWVRDRPAWSGAAAMAALLAKEAAVMLLPVLAIYEHGFRRPRPGRARAYLCQLAPLAVYFVLRVRALGGMVMGHYRDVPFGSQVLWAFYLTERYLARLVAPAPFHTIQQVLEPLVPGPEWSVLGGVVLVGAAAMSALWLHRRGHPLWFAVAWIFMALLPVEYLSWLRANAFGERYLYLCSVGFCWIVAALFQARPRAYTLPLFLILLLNYGLLARGRNSDLRAAAYPAARVTTLVGNAGGLARAIGLGLAQEFIALDGSRYSHLLGLTVVYPQHLSKTPDLDRPRESDFRGEGKNELHVRARQRRLRHLKIDSSRTDVPRADRRFRLPRPRQIHRKGQRKPTRASLLTLA